jgi:uncharacterized protein with HEPN domain
MSKTRGRLVLIRKKIAFIDEIVSQKGTVTAALEDEKVSRAAILMHLTTIAEQFDKLAKEGAFEILQAFDRRDLKGAYDMRNYIVHDYEGINLAIIDEVIRTKLPVMKRTIEHILNRDSETS